MIDDIWMTDLGEMRPMPIEGNGSIYFWLSRYSSLQFLSSYIKLLWDMFRGVSVIKISSKILHALILVIEIRVSVRKRFAIPSLFYRWNLEIKKQDFLFAYLIVSISLLFTFQIQSNLFHNSFRSYGERIKINTWSI